MLFELKYRPLDSFEDSFGPCNCPRNRRLTLRNLRGILTLNEQVVHLIDLLSVFGEDVAVLLLHLLLNTGACFTVIELLYELEGALSGSEVLEGVVDEEDRAILDFHDLAVELVNLVLPYFLVAHVVRLVHVLQRLGSIFHHGVQLLDTITFSRHAFELISKEGVKLLNARCCVFKIFADLAYLFSSLKELLVVTRPSVVAFVHVLSRSLVGILPLLQNLDTLVDELDRFVGFNGENMFQLYLPLDVVCDFIRNTLHEVEDGIIIVVTRDSPDQLQSIHKTGKAFLNCVEIVFLQVKELALQCHQEFLVVLGFGICLVELAQLAFEVVELDNFAHILCFIDNVDNLFDVW